MKTDLLASRHIGINEQDTAIMLRKIGVNSLDELINQTIPANIRLKEPLALTSPYSCIFMQLLKQVFDTAYSVLLVTEAQMPFHHEEQQIRCCRLYALQHRLQPS